MLFLPDKGNLERKGYKNTPWTLKGPLRAFMSQLLPQGDGVQTSLGQEGVAFKRLFRQN